MFELEPINRNLYGNWFKNTCSVINMDILNERLFLKHVLVAKDLKWLYEMCSWPRLVVKQEICDIMNVGDYP